MTFTLNHVMLAGNLTRDPEDIQIAEGVSVANLTLAINRRYRDRHGEQREEVVFIDCEAWNRTAEVIGQYLQKGRPILVEGRLKLDQWHNEQGEKRSRHKVFIERFQFIPDGRRNSSDRNDVAKDVRERHTSYPATANPAGVVGEPQPAYAATGDDELF